MKNWLVDVDLFVSDDFFKTQQMVLSGANKLVKTDHFMFASKYRSDTTVRIMISTAENDFLDFDRARFVGERNSIYDYVIMDTSEEVVFLFLNTYDTALKQGDLYVSDGRGHHFVKTLDRVMKPKSLASFERVNSLDATFLANKYDERDVSQLGYVNQDFQAFRPNPMQNEELLEEELE